MALLLVAGCASVAGTEVVTAEPASGIMSVAGLVDEELITEEGLTWEIGPGGDRFKSEDFGRYRIRVKKDGEKTKIKFEYDVIQEGPQKPMSKDGRREVLFVFVFFVYAFKINVKNYLQTFKMMV